MKDNNKINSDYDDYNPLFEFNEENQTINFDKSTNSNNSNKISNSKTKKNEKNSKNEEKEKEIKIGNYLIKKTLGKGTFGKVKLGIYLPRNKKVAIKILEKNRIMEEDDMIRLKREFEMLSQFNHPNVITVSEIFESNKEFFTVMEFCEGGELFNYIVANKRLSEEKSAFFYYQLINGLEYIHSLGIVHRDLKPENLLLTKDNILKIIDFGLSNYFKDDQPELLETPCGSPCYASPEMLSGKTYNGFKIDIWATGIILFAMLSGFLPFDDKDNNILFQKILECKITFPKFLSHDAKDLLEKILVINPLKRINIQNIKKHPFYLKGKEIFEKNFTISYFYDFKYMNENSFLSNFLYYEFDKKSEVILNRLKKEEIFCTNVEKRSNSFQINNKKNTNNLIYEDKNRNRKLKKLIDLEKRIKKMKKTNIKEKNETKNLKNEINDYDEKVKRNILNYNHSVTFHIKDINTFIENLIIQNKIEEDILNKLNKHNLEKNKKFIKPKKKNKSEDNTKKILKNKIDKNKKLNKKKEINNEKEKSSDSFNTLKKLINQNKKLSINYNNMNTKNNKSNNKKREPAKLNKIFINNNHIIKINKLQQSLKFQKPKRKLRSTSNNNSNKKNFKNILNMIKENSLKSNPNVNLVNKQNVIRHHTTNITNMTQKNYFSNVIINNYKANEHRLNSTCKHRCKILFESPNDKVDKNIKIKDYFHKNNASNINQMKKYNLKNWKLKSSLQKMKTNFHKMILKDENILKNSFIINSKNIINNTEEGASQNNSIVKNKKFPKMAKEIENKNIKNTTINKKKKQYKIRVSYINTNDLTNNKIYRKNLYLKSESSLKNYSMSKERYYEIKDSFSKYPLHKGIKYRILLADINLDEETINKGKSNYNSSTEKSRSYRSQSKNFINLLDKKKIGNISNKNWHKTGIKQIDNENIKRNSFGSKNIINFKKFQKLDIKDIISNNPNNYIIKTEANSISHHKKMNSQRTKSSGKKNLRTNNYLNSARIDEKKFINTSCNYINNQHYVGNMTENKQTYDNNSHVCSLIKFKANQKNMRSKNFTSKNYNYIKKNHVVNITNDNIKCEKNKNQNQQNNKEVNTLNNRRTFKIIGEKRRTNTNIYFDKFLESKKLLASLKKRINVKSMLISDIYDKKKENKTQKNSNENKMNNNSAITNFSTNVKKFNTNKHNNIKKKFLTKNNFDKNNDNSKLKKDLFNTLQPEKPKFKKLKIMKETMMMDIKPKICKKKLNLKTLNIDNNSINNNSKGLYFYNNTELNSTYSNKNTNENSLFKSPIIKSKKNL